MPALVAPDFCQDCIFTKMCMPLEKINRNSDGLCDDFTRMGVENEEVGSDNSERPFPVG